MNKYKVPIVLAFLQNIQVIFLLQICSIFNTSVFWFEFEQHKGRIMACLLMFLYSNKLEVKLSLSSFYI